MSVATSYAPGYLSRYAATGNRGLGDIFSDLQAIAGATEAYQQAGSIGPWLSQRLGQFRALPGRVNSTRAQVAAVRQVFTQNGVTTSSVGDALTTADLLLNDVQQNYPSLNAQVNALTLKLLPVLPKINAGTYDSSVISALANSGIDLVSTIHGVNDAIDKADQAQQTVENVTLNPALPADVRQQAVNALAQAGTMDWVKVAALGVIGFVVIKAVFK